MTATTHYRKPSDDHSKWTYTLTDRDGNTIDVSSVTAVRIYADAPDGTAELSGASMTVTDGANGKVEYDVQSGDFAATGDYAVDFEIEYGDGSTQIVPHDGIEKLTVTDQVK